MPGGNENGVFDAYRLPPDVRTPRKNVKYYLKSHVFDIKSPSQSRASRATPASNTTHEHIFPAEPLKPVLVRHNNMKSTVFDADPPRKKRALAIKRNPITGELCKSFDDPVTPKARNVRNPVTFEGIPENRLPRRSGQPLRKKMKYHMKSEIFDIQSPKPAAIRNNNTKSTVFDPDPPKKMRALAVKRNPITGELCKSYDDPITLKARSVRNPVTFQGIPDDSLRSRYTQPPGGKSSLVLEHNE